MLNAKKENVIRTVVSSDDEDEVPDPNPPTPDLASRKQNWRKYHESRRNSKDSKNSPSSTQTEEDSTREGLKTPNRKRKRAGDSNELSDWDAEGEDQEEDDDSDLSDIDDIPKPFISWAWLTSFSIPCYHPSTPHQSMNADPNVSSITRWGEIATSSVHPGL